MNAQPQFENYPELDIESGHTGEHLRLDDAEVDKLAHELKYRLKAEVLLRSRRVELSPDERKILESIADGTTVSARAEQMEVSEADILDLIKDGYQRLRASIQESVQRQ